jgi:nicotinamide-nucleotide amidase
MARAELVIFMGGLGPTEDDLTREAVAASLGLPLRRDMSIVSALEKRFAERGWKMAPNNHKQADVIAGAAVLPNANGTAPGQWIAGRYDGAEKIVLLLPGPPKIPEQHIATRVLKIAMMGESQCDARVAPIYKQFEDVETTILAGAGEIQLHLKTKAASLEQASARLNELVDKLEEELQDFVFSDNGDSLELIVGYYLQMRNATLAVAESCTGGLLAERITSIGGSSRYFLGGAVVYSNELKTEFADVPAELIEMHGAVSKQVAVALAEGIRKRCRASFGIGITGVAGPTGGTPEKPVGLVFHALAGERGTEVVEKRFGGDRNRIRWFASQQALDMVRRKLM